MSMKVSTIVIPIFKGSDYCCIISLISKNETINLMQNAHLIKKKWNIIKSVKHYKLKNI